MIRAVIAIGSNAIRMLAARPDGRGGLVCLRRERRATRPFAGLIENRFTMDSMRATLRAVIELKQIALDAGARQVDLFATSATRDAANADELIRAIDDAAGLRLRVISGEQEAAYSFLGAAGRGEAMVMDIGGGSTECVMGCAPSIRNTVSLQLGAVRLHGALPIRNPQDAEESMKLATREFERHAYSFDRVALPARFVGVGGTLTALGAHRLGVDDPTDARIQGLSVSLSEIAALLTLLANTRLPERSAIAGVSEQRADILPSGLAILLAGMRFFGYTRVETSIRGNMDGYLLSI